MMMCVYFAFVVYFACCIPPSALEESNDNDIHSNSIHSNHLDKAHPVPRPDFRMLKYQEVWDLALKRIKDVQKLKDLTKTLLKLDRSELEFKRKKEAGDPTYYAEAEQSVVDMLPTVLKRFGVLDQTQDWKPKETHFDDFRLQNSWKKVVAEGEFNGGELKKLHAEFHEMQKRLHDYVWLTRRIEEYENQLNNETDNESSHVTSNFVDEDHENVRAGEEDHGISNALKLAHMRKRMLDDFHRIDEDVMVLTERVKERIAETKRENVFTDSRVKELWEKAQEILIKNDLEIFKTELDQFQNRISKLHHWEKIAETLRAQLNDAGHDKELKEEYSFAKEKVKELQKFVKKYHATLFNRVYSHFKEEL